MINKIYFSTSILENKEVNKSIEKNKKNQKYGHEIRDKFTKICDEDLIAKVLNTTENITMLSRSDEIESKHIGNSYAVYNGMHNFILDIKKNMVGFKVGEFVASRKIKNLNENHKFKLRRYEKLKKEVLVPLNNLKLEGINDKIVLVEESDKKI